MSIGKAAEYLGVSPSTIRLWVSTGKLRAYRTLGKHRRFLMDDLSVFMNQIYRIN